MKLAVAVVAVVVVVVVVVDVLVVVRRRNIYRQRIHMTPALASDSCCCPIVRHRVRYSFGPQTPSSEKSPRSQFSHAGKNFGEEEGGREAEEEEEENDQMMTKK